MKKKSILKLTIFILIALLLGVGVFFLKITNFLTEHHILIAIVIGFIAYIIGISSNLVTFLITYYWGDQKEINEKQDEAFIAIKEIKEHTNKESNIVLKFEDRKDALGTGFYDKIYNRASKIKISGIKMNSLINYICQEKKDDNNWIKKLEERKNVTVRILMASPSSESIPILEKQEGVPPGTYKDEIERNIERLKILSKAHKRNLARGSSISIRTINDIQYFNITYAGHEATQDTDILLLSFIFDKDAGPIYEMPSTNKVNTYSECLLHFDNQFERAQKQIFYWDNEGIHDI